MLQADFSGAGENLRFTHFPRASLLNSNKSLPWVDYKLYSPDACQFQSDAILITSTSQLWDFTRFGGKTSNRLVNWCPVCVLCDTYYLITERPFKRRHRIIDIWISTVNLRSMNRFNFIPAIPITIRRRIFSVSKDPGGRLNKKDGLTRYGDSHVKDKTS